MTPPRGGSRYRTRGVTAGQRSQAHIDWLKLIETSGPFLSVPVLADEWPDLEALDTRALERLRQEHRQWQEDPARNRAGWISYVLGDLLGWGDALGRDGLDRLALPVREHETTLVPSFTLTDPATGQLVLLGLVSDGPPAARITGSDWPATPADRLAMLCRHHGTELGLATDGRWWVLVWAPAKGGVTTTAVFDAVAWPEPAERDVVRAFLSLLERRRFFAVPEQRRLPAMLRQSLGNQEEITDRLGVQVRQAVELLVAAFGRADAEARDRGQPGLAAVTAGEVYRGAVTVMMRIIFLLFAEESGLLPADSELYARAYSVAGLAGELEQRVTDARGNEGELEHTYLAWHRLLALFTAVYRGIDHPDLDLIAHDGSLFDPDAHPWLEGRRPGDDSPGTPLAVDDRTVLHMLRAVQTVTISGELRTVSFRTLTVEQIGYAYEGLLSYEGFRAAGVVVGLAGREGHEAEVPLEDLERAAASAAGAAELAVRLADTYKDSGIGTARALAARLGPLAADDQGQAEARLYAVTRDHDLVRRLLPYWRIIRRDLRGDPVVILPGALYVTESALRASSGAHYTPKFLAQEVAEGALEPLVYQPGPLQTADRSAWKLRTPGEILSLKVADIAMGSGAFLVAACRYLAGKLIEAWSVEGDPRAARHLADGEADALLDLDVTADPVVIDARRQVIEHCLYGVDINPMAVEMAKLSLWLVSMDPRRPFTFLDDRLVTGDSLLGITSAEQLEWMHLDPREGRKLHEGALLDFTAGVRTLLAHVAAERLGLVDITDSDIQALNKKRQILASVRARTEQLARYADLIVGAGLAGARQGNLWMIAAQTASKAATKGAIEDAVIQARDWLATDLPAGGFDRQPLHWPLVFPEVFESSRPSGAGFDALIGNPPFLGGKKISGMTGSSYREYLVEQVAGRTKGNSDLVAYFFLRAHSLINDSGQCGLIATNSLAQLETQKVGLGQASKMGIEIRSAINSKKWPSRSANLEYCVVWTTRCRLGPDSRRLLDGQEVNGITSSLEPVGRTSTDAVRLYANRDVAFMGSILGGEGFILDQQKAEDLLARDPKNSDVIYRLLDGRDITRSPYITGRRWVINFHDWTLERATQYEDCLEIVRRQVKPVRDRNPKKAYRERWWQYIERGPSLYRAVRNLDRVIVISLTSSTAIPVFVPTERQVFSNACGVFTLNDPALLAILSSSAHYWWWLIVRPSTLETRMRYTTSETFETFPRPIMTQEMRDLGVRLDSARRGLMLARGQGLTATYKLVHDKECADQDVTELRELHRAIDEAVTRAYGWEDLLAHGLDYGFHEWRRSRRYTIGPTVRQEVLDRLLVLNHEQYGAEVAAGLHTGRGRQRASLEDGDATLF